MKSFLKKIYLIDKTYGFAVRLLTPPSALFKRRQSQLFNRSVLEIGGPSPIFERGNLIPIYGIAGRVDNCNFASKNFWSDLNEGRNFLYDGKRKIGNQCIQDATELNLIPANTYDVLCASHVIEHIANPIKALLEWKRVLKPNGCLVVIAPDKRFTYDRNRPITSMGHIIEDYEKGVEENDSTHFDEIIALHDLSVDSTVASFEEHKRRTLNNAVERIAHHHVFDAHLFCSLLQYAGFTQVEVEERKPFHLIAFAQLPTENE